MNKNKFFIRELLAVLILVFLDLLTKKIAVKTLSDGSVQVIPGVFSFTLLEGGNSGAAFGLFKGGFWLFFVITLAVIVFVIFILRRINSNKRYLPAHFVLVLLLSGAVGNFVDRVTTMIEYGHSFVIDFLYFELINFPIFNVADCYVTVAAVLMLLLGFFYYKEEDYDRILKGE